MKLKEILRHIKDIFIKAKDGIYYYSDDIATFFQFTWLWGYPVIFIITKTCILSYASIGSYDHQLSIWGYLLVGGISLIPFGLISARNGWDYVVHHKRDFSLRTALHLNPTSMSNEKMVAAYPPIPHKYLSTKPEGFILGEYKHKYVRFQLDRNNIMMGIIMGAPGVGKTAAIYLTTLIANFMKEPDEQMVSYTLDIKPEIAVKCVEIHENPNVRVMNPTDRSSWGWDVYYEIHDLEDAGKEVTESFVVKVLNKIGGSLIVSDNPKEKFFTTSGIRCFTGMMLFYYKKGYSFIDGVSEVIEKPMDAHLKEILGDKKLCPKNSKIRSLLASFVGKDSDAVQDIELSLQENLAIFLDDDVRWHLRDNPLKARPTDLNRGISLFNCFPEDLLDDASYPALFRLQTNQVLQALQNRSPNSQACALVLDECARIGKLPALPNLLATGRSRRCSCWIAIQDYSQLENLYGKEGARGIINLCRIKCILGCDDDQTQKVLGNMAGDYREIKTTTSDGEHGSKTSKTYEWRKVVESKDLMSLDEKEEIILFIKGRYMRIKKHFYFEDDILRKRNQEVMDFNEYKEV